ncbi:mavicyanin-like [Andrographis paniculata]|uniref:mavicyanin-like n=1 Tax=Andrographis paniculata TaxID=175694 RepID=UPI0021E88B62|nr:mavicyanin-like [Andrographis paniculata]
MGGNASISFLVLIVIFQVCNAEVYKVGDAAGWTTICSPDYKAWAASKKFKVGDSLLTPKNYDACNASGASQTWVSGNDTLAITKPGKYYFICGTPGHCQKGQKVAITVA